MLSNYWIVLSKCKLARHRPRIFPGSIKEPGPRTAEELHQHGFCFSFRHRCYNLLGILKNSQKISSLAFTKVKSDERKTLFARLECISLYKMQEYKFSNRMFCHI